jgi:hypothetical protein
VVTHNPEIQIRTDNQTFHLHVAEITQSTLDENSCTYNLYTCDLKTGLTTNTSLSSKKFCNGQTHRKERFKRITGRMRFVITCRAGKAIFQEKENKNKEEEPAKLE